MDALAAEGTVFPNASPSWASIEYRADGVWLTVRPGAPASAMAEAVTDLLVRGVPGVDFSSLQAAWAAQSGLPVRIAPRPPSAPSVPALSLDPFLRTEERDGEVHLTISPAAMALSERDLVTWLNRRDYSGLDLDLVRAAHTGPRGAQYPITRSSGAPRAEAPGLVEARTVLVADADETYRARVSEALARRGLVVRTARYAEAAVFETRQRAIDAVLLAHPFGREDGLRLCHELKRDPRGRGLAVIAVCAQPTRETVRRALECGVNDILVRPSPPGALLHKVESALKRVGKRLPKALAEARDAESRPPGEEMKTLGKIDIAKLVAAVERLHALPGVVERVLSLTSDPDTGAKQLADCIQGEPAVAAVVLRMANSALYGGTGRTANVADAIVRIGFLQTKSLVVGMSVIKTFSKGMKSAGFDRTLFWRHSIGTAIVSRLLAESIRMGASEVAFVAGLLHDVGKLLLDEFVPMEFSTAVMTAIERRAPLIDVEPSILQTTHVEVGPAVLAVWRFPEAVITAVRNHHVPVSNPEALPPAVRELCDVVFAANRLAKATGRGHGGDLAIEEVPEAVWVRLGLGAGLPEGFWKRFHAEAERFEALLGIETEAEPEAGGGDATAYVCDPRPARVSLLTTALESAGYRVTTGRDASGAVAAPVAVARSEAAEGLLATMRALAAQPSLSGSRVVGVLPRGVAAPPGALALVEPYDRQALLDLLGRPPASPRE